MAYANTEVGRAAKRRQQSRYREAHRERIHELQREHNRKWRENHPGVAAAASLRWQKANLDRHADAERRRRARKAGGATDHHTRVQVFERDGGICQICGLTLDPLDWHEDHIIPIARGGHDLLANVQATCPPCNRHKHANIA